ncbi:MAG TPA: hypothetical protein VGR82_07930 [Methylomirabilota bacterium]|nr:hypothetical protein [Methylomirabilota bacterium]
MARLAAVVLAVVTAACASAPARPAALPPAAAVPGFAIADDTFAFRNEIRARHPGATDLYANYCFVLARAVRQFHQFARFDAGAPRVAPEEYVRRVRAVGARAPWQPSLPAAERVVIPGYPSLRAFSAAQETAVKEGLGARFWTLVHWTNWRTTMPVPDGHQEAVLHEVIAELAAGRLVQLLVTNWPKPELNHTVVAYGYLLRPAGAELTVWDPNDLSGPGTVMFDARADRFVAAHVYETRPGPIRVFRMYYSWLL